MQARLKDLGYYSGEIDGQAGPKTEAATSAFKAAHGFVSRPYPGPLTIATMFGEGAKQAAVAPAGVPPWYAEMASHIGLHERNDNAELRAWLRSDGSTVGDPAQIPWCGDAVQTAIANTLPDEKLPDNPYLALNWTKFGRPCPPAIGAVLVFHNGNPASMYGHVCLLAGEDSTTYHCLGGNQSNAVTITRILKSRLRKNGMRWPLTYPLPSEGGLSSVADGAVSTSER